MQKKQIKFIFIIKLKEYILTKKGIKGVEISSNSSLITDQRAALLDAVALEESVYFGFAAPEAFIESHWRLGSATLKDVFLE